jgi:hypothetical protein
MAQDNLFSFQPNNVNDAQQGLLSAFNPSDALPAPRYTGMLLPIERDMYGTKGNFELAVPQFLQDAYSGINKFGQAFRGELSPQELQQLAFDTSMNVTGGSLLGSRVIPNAVPKGGVLSMGVSKTPNQTGLLGKVDNVQPKSGVSEVVPPTDKSDGIIAFHGSPYDFNKFSLSKINTGEGAQAFGHGLYFSSKEDIAKFYRDSVRGFKDLSGQTDWKYKGKSFEMHPDDAQNIEDKGVALLVQEMRLTSRYPEKARETLIKKHEKEIKRLKQITKAMRDRGYYPNMPDDILGLGADIELEELIIGSLQREIDAVKKINLSDIKQSKGSMYQVKLNTINDDLIDYDKPLGQQSENVKNILNKMKSEVNLDDARNLGFDPFDYGGNEKRAIEEAKKVLFGKDEDVVRFLNNWSAIRGEQAIGEKLLAKYGAKGIQYLDNSARNTFGGKLLSVDKTPDGFKAKVVLDDPSRQTGVGGSGRVITTSKPYKTEKEARDWAKKSIEKKDTNYVIFDDKIIDIMKKYGIVGAVGVTAMQGGEQSPEANLSL